MRHLVFVYGTLRQGQSNHHYVQDCELLGRFDTPNRREQIETTFGLAWVYLYQLELTANKEILSGDWCK